MNWMTSAKNRVSKGRSKKKDFRLNAHYKLPAAPIRLPKQRENNAVVNDFKPEPIFRINQNISADVISLSNKIGQKLYSTLEPVTDIIIRNESSRNINRKSTESDKNHVHVTLNIMDELVFTPVS